MELLANGPFTTKTWGKGARGRERVMAAGFEIFAWGSAGRWQSLGESNPSLQVENLAS